MRVPSPAWRQAVAQATRDGEVNSTLLFYRVFRNNLGVGRNLVLDVGCGRGVGVGTTDPEKRELFDLHSIADRVIGLDVDPGAVENPRIDQFHLIRDGEPWPIETGTVDGVISDWVLEHVDDADLYMSELRRVLKPGGVFALRTVSKYSVPALAARVVPNRRHTTVLGVLQPTREHRDVFPTTYHLNSPGAISEACARVGLVVECASLPGIHTYRPRGSRVGRAIRTAERLLPASLQHTIIALGWSPER